MLLGFTAVFAAINRLVEEEPVLFAEWEASLVAQHFLVYHKRNRIRELPNELLAEGLANISCCCWATRSRNLGSATTWLTISLR
ncbi:hypothetical protein B0T14DRAFT_274435 [Immersiella caudata]|uniref:Uncharacterized protein n=1 Tax=Immersiella caudata TaxID=314043 RepID=A0AA39WLN9_9PEZI|nr:hypothetical protein B0T14DRAFT_274435 [Immersiella caudata]